MMRCYTILKEYFDDRFDEVLYDMENEAFLNLEDAEAYLISEGYEVNGNIEDDGFIEYKKADGSHDFAIIRRISVY